MFDTSHVRAEERVCDACKSLIERVLASEHTLRALLGNPYLDLRDFVAVRGVSKQCATAVDFLHAKWSRFGQAWFDSGAPCDSVVAVLLQQNRHLLHGHPNWEILAALSGPPSSPSSPSQAGGTPSAEEQGCGQACGQRAEEAAAPTTRAKEAAAPTTRAEEAAAPTAGAKEAEAPTTRAKAAAACGQRASCRLLRCRKTCRPAMTAGQCMWVLARLDTDGASAMGAAASMQQAVRRRALDRLRAAKAPAGPEALFELVPFVPSLVWLAVRSTDVLRQVVLPAVRICDEFAFLAYFCTRGHENLRFVKAEVYAALSPAQAAEVAASENWLTAVLHLTTLPTARHPDLAAHLLEPRPFVPGSARLRITGVHVTTLRRLKSSTLPWAVQCRLLDTATGRVQDRTLLFKKEPMWNDLAVSLVQRYLLAVDPSLELEPYHVCPLGPAAGLLLFVPGCKTLHEIEQAGSILKWLTDSNPSKSCASVQQTFMRSCAANSIVSRLLGFGDRHLQNILCTGESGRLVHVDFAYLWSAEPAVSRHRILLPEQTMRITPGMLQVFDAHYYADFLALCTQINRMVRSAAVDLHYVCWGLVAAGCAPEAVVRTHFSAFTLPYAQNGRDADAAIVSVIQHETETRPKPLVNLFRMLLRYVE
jgi:hypothetical protein